jgi:DNA-binding beta-propeller fold protein YncE
VALSNGSIFIANTAAGTVEVVDGEHLRHQVTIPGCPEASGVLVAKEECLVFAAARGAGKLLVIDAVFTNVLREVAVGSRPNGLAWDPRRKHLLVADMQDNTARLVDPQAGQVIATAILPGRPRWAVYDRAGDRFLVNIREPALIGALSASTFALVGQFPVSEVGPHGLDLDQEGRRAFVACDGGSVVALDTTTGSELAKVPIAGTPDAIWHKHRLPRLYVAIQDPGAIDVVNTDTIAIDEQIAMEVGAHTSASMSSCRVAVSPCMRKARWPNPSRFRLFLFVWSSMHIDATRRRTSQ